MLNLDEERELADDQYVASVAPRIDPHQQMINREKAALATSNDQNLAKALREAHSSLEQVDDIIAVVALALRGQGCELDCACANTLENFAYPELEQARDAIRNALRLAGVEEETSLRCEARDT